MTPIPAALLNYLMNHISVLGLDKKYILANSGINQDWQNNHSRVNNYAVIQVMQEIVKFTNDESMGFAENRITPGFAATFMEYCLNSETISHMIHRIARIVPHLQGFDDTSYAYRVYGNELEIIFNLKYKSEHDQFFWSFYMLSAFYRFLCWSVDETIPQKKICFSAPAQDNFFDEELENLLNSDVEFFCEHNALIFDQAFMDRPIVKTKSDLWHWLSSTPADAFSLPNNDKSISNQIKSILLKNLKATEPFPNFEEICKKLHSSSQVVRRKLSEEGTSYQQLKDKVRSNLAKELLRVKDIPTAEITMRVGFTEVAAFTRAFKSWTGTTPAQYRDSC